MGWTASKNKREKDREKFLQTKSCLFSFNSCACIRVFVTFFLNFALTISSPAPGKILQRIRWGKVSKTIWIFFFEAKCLDRWLHICLTSGWMNKNLNNEYKDFLTFLFRFKFFYFFGILQRNLSFREQSKRFKLSF